MPVYVYRNLSTGETFEVVQRITEPALAVHPTTGDPVKRLVQPVGIAFKGSGFYVNDSRSNRARTANGKSGGSAGGEGKGEPASAAKGDGASEASPATKPSSSSPAPASD